MTDAPGGRAARYLLIAQTLTDAIGRGDFPVGSRLPTEPDLSRRFKVSRFTIRAALQELAERALIVRRPGIGTVVIEKTPRSHYSEGYISIDDMMRVTASASIKVETFADIVVTDAEAAVLGCKADQPFFYLQGYRLDPTRHGAPPLGWVEVYVDPAFGGIRDALPDLDGPLIELIERRYHQRVAAVDQEITATFVPEEIADRLQVQPGAPAMRIQRWYRDAGNAAFEIARNIFPLGRFTYKTRLVRQASRDRGADAQAR